MRGLESVHKLRETADEELSGGRRDGTARLGPGVEDIRDGHIESRRREPVKSSV